MKQNKTSHDYIKGLIGAHDIASRIWERVNSEAQEFLGAHPDNDFACHVAKMQLAGEITEAITKAIDEEINKL